MEHTRIRVRTAWLIGCGLLALAAPAAARPTVEVSIDADEVFVGQPFRLELNIEGDQAVAQPDMPEIPHCSVQYSGSSALTQIINGRVTQRTTLTYIVTANQAGRLVIPAIAVDVGGRVVRSEPLEIEVHGPAERPTVAQDDSGNVLLLAEVRCDEQRLYVGQQARFTLTFWIKVPDGLGTRLDARDLYSLLANRRTGFGRFPEPRNAQLVPLEMDDGTRANYYQYASSAEIVVERPGPIAFDDLVIAMDYPVRLSRDIFGQVRLTRSTPLRIRPKIVAPTVRPLPTDGRPPGFNGAVGRLRLSTRADATVVRVGDPIKLTIEISGKGPLDTLAGPRLESQPALTAGFRVPAETLAGQTVRGRRIFTQIIRAKRADVREIPPIEYPYFNPQTEQYEVARSKPIPLTVRASDLATADDLLKLPAGTSAGEPVKALDGLRGLKSGEAELLANTTPVSPMWLGVALVGPPVAFFGFWGCAAVFGARLSDPSRRRRQRALSNALRRLHQANGQPADAAAALASYLADRLDEPPGRFTGRTAVDWLRQRGVEQATVAACAQLIEQAEAAAYGGASSDGSLVRLAEQCLRRLEREKL